MKQETKEAIEWVLNNLDKIPSNLFEDYDLDTWKPEDKLKEKNMLPCIWILDREDGTAGDWETSQERLGVRKDGEIVWGFTSGCSCWSGWDIKDYENRSYKEFIVKNIVEYNPKDDYYKIKDDSDIAFSQGWEEEVIKNVNDIKGSEMKKEFCLSDKIIFDNEFNYYNDFINVKDVKEFIRLVKKISTHYCKDFETMEELTNKIDKLAGDKLIK